MFPELSLWYAACAAIAAILSRSIGRFVLRHAEKLKLVQTANHRSSHSAPTPAGGGIGIADGATLALLLLAMALPSPLLWPVCGLSLLIAAVGLIDDIRNLPARARLSAQALALASGGEFDTICVHGDGARAIETAEAVRRALDRR